MKVVVLCILTGCAHLLYGAASSFLVVVSWNAKLKLVFVMILTPCCMNAIQFWLTDNFIKKGGVTFQQLYHGCLRCCAPCSGGMLTARAVAQDHRREADPESARERGHSAGAPSRHSAGSLAQPLLGDDRKALLEDIAYLTARVDELSTVSARDRSDKQYAEALAARNQDAMHEAEERLHKAQQEVRMHIETEKLLR